MVAVPADTPVTTPVVMPTVAVERELLVHVPPAIISVSVIVEPTQTSLLPIMAGGNAYTVTVTVAAQPVPNV